MGASLFSIDGVLIMFDLFQQGGGVMYVLLLMSVLATAIILLKLYQFYHSGLRKTAFVDEVATLVADGEYITAIEKLKSQTSPVARVLESAVRFGSNSSMSSDDVEAEVSRVGSAQIRSLESWLRGLSSIAHLSPLLGLLGTVTGMIVAFMNLQAAGSRVDPSILSGGIWEALLTTAFGLTVAIPAMAAFYYLEGEVDNVRASMKDASIRILRHFGKSPHMSHRDDERIEDETHGL